MAGKLAGRRNEWVVAADLVAEAMALMETTEDPSGLGDVLLDRAEVCFLAGETAEARMAAARARACYADKVNLAGVRRAERIGRCIAAEADPLG